MLRACVKRQTMLVEEPTNRALELPPKLLLTLQPQFDRATPEAHRYPASFPVVDLVLATGDIRLLELARNVRLRRKAV